MRVLASISAFLFAALLLAVPSRAQKVELFGGYSYEHAPVTFEENFCPVVACPTTPPTFTTPHLNLNGWEASGAVKLFGPLGLAADFSDTSGSFHGANARLKTYLFGPQIRFPGPVSPFAHVLIGGAHESLAPAPACSAARHKTPLPPLSAWALTSKFFLSSLSAPFNSTTC
jgi:hypothetical protein